MFQINTSENIKKNIIDGGGAFNFSTTFFLKRKTNILRAKSELFKCIFTYETKKETKSQFIQIPLLGKKCQVIAKSHHCQTTERKNVAF